jgi:3-hydroxyisobutyrate dehydrogenase-like beta-hydroxyacid dehydrogenase
MGEAVGYVGLGVMGLPYAGHLASAGHRVTVFDRDPAAMDRARAQGLPTGDSVAAVVDAADILFTCLPSPAAVRDVYADVAKPGLVACDNSTIDPNLARSLQAELKSRGVGYVECPMLGGVGEAEAGRLFIIVSGDATDVDRVLPLALVGARDHRVVGGPSTASLFKSVQNGLGLVQLTAIAEALALVASAGGDLDAFIDVVGEGGGMAATPLFRAKAPAMRDPNASAVGKLYIGAKDAALAAGLAEAEGLDLPLFRRSESVYRAAIAAGLAERDISAIVRVIEAETGARIARS